MSELQVQERATEERPRPVKLVDTDIHPTPSRAALAKRLPKPAAEHLARYGRRSPPITELYPRAANAGMRADAWPEDPDLPAGGTLELLQRQVLDEYDVDYGLLNCLTLLDCYDPPELAIGLARAANDWMQEEWIERDERLLGAVVVPADYPELSVKEIERFAGDPRWVQVIFPGSPQETLGSEKYWPIYEAAAGLGKVVGIHNGGYDSHSGAGWPSYYLEEHVAYAFVMQTQLLSMAVSGVFERFPDLRVCLVEGGSTWATSLRWALDEAFELMRDDVPGLSRRPSEAIHEHVWFTTQPIDEPDDPAHLEQAIEHGHLADRLVFATDYPHWDFDSPSQVLPSRISREVRAKIMAGNACELYRLPLR